MHTRWKIMYWQSDYNRLSKATPTEGCAPMHPDVFYWFLDMSIWPNGCIVSMLVCECFQLLWKRLCYLSVGITNGLLSQQLLCVEFPLFYIQMVGSDERCIPFHLNTPLRITSLFDLFVSSISILNLFFGK